MTVCLERVLALTMLVTSFSQLFTSFFLYCVNNPQLYNSLYRVASTRGVSFLKPYSLGGGVGGGASGDYKNTFSVEEDVFYSSNLSSLYSEFAYFPEYERFQMRDQVKEMFSHAYNSYMTHAFPMDELNPLNCSGRGADPDISNINVNDALGNYSLTLVDSLDAIALLGDTEEFKRAVNLVIKHVSFDTDTNVQVFEANIRVLGALLSAHLLAKNENSSFGETGIANYDDELLDLAKDLATRLLPAFFVGSSSMPLPRVNLRHGVLKDISLKQDVNCLAGAGTLILEFGLLSHLTGDPIYESVARNAIRSLWQMRDNVTKLFGNSFNLTDESWESRLSGLGAGMDSFYEYLIKAYIMFNDEDYLTLFNEAYEVIQTFNKEGRNKCLSSPGNYREVPPIFRNVDLKTGDLSNNWIDSLQAALPGIMVLYGDIEEAICQHALHFAIWQKYSALPERFNIALQTSELHFYPLRPELAESTYLLYRATKSPFYLHVGRIIAEDINKYSRTQCGFATMKNVKSKTLEDRMESFVISETFKYLYLLFDEENVIHKAGNSAKYIFSTEGHLMPVIKPKLLDFWLSQSPLPVNKRFAKIKPQCESVPFQFQHSLPLPPHLLYQIESLVGLRP